MVSGGVSTPGHGQGEGPVGYKFPPKAGTQETMGGAGAKRSPPDTIYPSNKNSYILNISPSIFFSPAGF